MCRLLRVLVSALLLVHFVIPDGWILLWSTRVSMWMLWAVPCWNARQDTYNVRHSGTMHSLLRRSTYVRRRSSKMLPSFYWIIISRRRAELDSPIRNSCSFNMSNLVVVCYLRFDREWIITNPRRPETAMHYDPRTCQISAKIRQSTTVDDLTNFAGTFVRKPLCPLCSQS